MIEKKAWSTFGCKLGQSDPIVMEPRPDSTCRVTYWTYKLQIDISNMLKKVRKMGQTDGSTLLRDNTTVCRTSVYISWNSSHFSSVYGRMKHYRTDAVQRRMSDVVSRWWRHQMETFSAWSVTSTHKWQVARSFDFFLWSVPQQTVE